MNKLFSILSAGLFRQMFRSATPVALAALGGAGALMAASVQELEVLCWDDLGCEAVRRLEVTDMPLTVILDPHGGNLYESGPAAYLAQQGK